MDRLPENQQTAGKQRAFLLLALAIPAILMVSGCLLAKRFVLNAAISNGMGTPVSPLPGLLFSALAFSAPVQSAFLLSLLPCSWFCRTAIACGWMIVVMSAFSMGNQSHPFHDSPAIFGNQLLCVLPLFAFGWFIPLGLLRRLRGWQVHSGLFSRQPKKSRPVSISGLLALTLLVSLCLSALQIGPEGEYLSGLTGMLAGIVFGFIFSLAVCILMKLPPVFSLACYILIGAASYTVARLAMLVAGAGTLANGNALFFSVIVLAVLSGFAVARCFGVELVTGLSESRDDRATDRSGFGRRRGPGIHF